MGKDSAARIELGRSFHQMGTVNEKVSERDFVPLWDGTVTRRSLAELSHSSGSQERGDSTKQRVLMIHKRRRHRNTWEDVQQPT